MAGIHWSAQLANTIAQQTAALKVKPSIGAIQQAQGMQFQPSQGVRPPMQVPPKQAGRQSSQPQRYPSSTPPAQAQTLAGARMLKEADRGTTNPSADSLARRKLEQRAMGVEEKYAKEQQQLAILEAAKASAALQQSNLDAQQRARVQAQIVYKAGIQSGLSPEQSQNHADMALQDPEYADSVMLKFQDAGEKIRQEGAGYAREDKKEDWDSAEMANALFNAYPEVDKGVISALVQTDSSFTELSTWLDKRAESAEEDRTLTARLMRAQADSEFETDSAIRQIGKTLGLSDEFGATGFLGAFIKKIPSTAAYELDKSIDVQKAKMAFTELLEMRRQSETGGALGNVSNREIELLYSAFTALDQGLGKDKFQSNMTDVLQRFERVKFMIANEKAMGEAGLTPQEMNDAANQYTSMQVAAQMDTPPEDVQYLFDNPDTAKDFEKTYGWRPIQLDLDKGHLLGWKGDQ